MAPLILHNTPDDEFYAGNDGLHRPYAMVFPAKHERSRRAESGSFGKSSRRSRSKTATPAKREDLTAAAADKVFNNWFQTHNTKTDSSPPDDHASRRESLPAMAAQDGSDTGDTKPSGRASRKRVPTEVVFRGYRSPLQQYAVVDHFEKIAGRICEDYARDPPAEVRRFKSEFTSSLARRQLLTREERALVARVAGGNHWVKVTFESAEAALTAIDASPQSIMGYLVFCEPYNPNSDVHDKAIAVDLSKTAERVSSPNENLRNNGFSGPFGDGFANAHKLRARNNVENISQVSSYTMDTSTMTAGSAESSETMASSATVTGVFYPHLRQKWPSNDHDNTTPNALPAPHQKDQNSNDQCLKIPTARRIRPLAAEKALLPSQSNTQRVMNKIPVLKWFNGSIIGNQVPRTDLGEFDWDRASLYWKLTWWLDATFKLFGGEIVHADWDE